MSSFRLDIESLRFLLLAASERPAAHVPVDPLERPGLTSARHRLLQSRANTARAKVSSKAKLGADSHILDVSHEKIAFSRDASLCIATDSELARVLASIEALEKRRSEIFSTRKTFQSLARNLRRAETSSVPVGTPADSTVDGRSGATERCRKAVSGEMGKDDAEGIICMWELMGECADPECRFAHTRK